MNEEVKPSPMGRMLMQFSISSMQPMRASSWEAESTTEAAGHSHRSKFEPLDVEGGAFAPGESRFSRFAPARVDRRESP